MTKTSMVNYFPSNILINLENNNQYIYRYDYVIFKSKDKYIIIIYKSSELIINNNKNKEK
jgi:hypothetical protein